MSQSSTTPIYLVADLIDERLYDFSEGAVVQSYNVEVGGDMWHICGLSRTYGSTLFRIPRDASVGEQIAIIRQYLRGYFRRLKTPDAPPALDAGALGRKVRDRWPLTAAQLLHDPTFAALARKAALARRAYTQDLLDWEKKAVVIEAVAIVRAQVEAERAAEEARLQAERDAWRAQRDREQPTRDAVLAAYYGCDYRVCKQDHQTTVEIVPPARCPGVRSDVSKGDRYSSRCTWKKNESSHTLRVRTDWLQRVAARGLETFEGRLVLDAAEIGHTRDLSRSVLRLLTVRQARGTSLETEPVEVVYDGFTCERLAKGEEVVAYADERIAHDALIDVGLVAG